MIKNDNRRNLEKKDIYKMIMAEVKCMEDRDERKDSKEFTNVIIMLLLYVFAWELAGERCGV